MHGPAGIFWANLIPLRATASDFGDNENGGVRGVVLRNYVEELVYGLVGPARVDTAILSEHDSNANKITVWISKQRQTMTV